MSHTQTALASFFDQKWEKRTGAISATQKSLLTLRANYTQVLWLHGTTDSHMWISCLISCWSSYTKGEVKKGGGFVGPHSRSCAVMEGG